MCRPARDGTRRGRIEEADSVVGDPDSHHGSGRCQDQSLGEEG